MLNFYSGRIWKALGHLFPDIGLDVREFRAHRMIETLHTPKPGDPNKATKREAANEGTLEGEDKTDNSEGETLKKGDAVQ